MPATSAVLTGLSLATGIAREATDGVPIVKQVLGVASRIVELAEKVDKNREDLHALADRAKKMDATITDIIGDRELDGRMLRRLDDMNLILRAVEKHFENHIRKGRVRKTLDYIFSVRRDIDRLKAELDDRLNQLEVAANLDTNLFARENSRFIGEFRNIRHCEITLLRPIERQRSEDIYAVNCHLATCEGSDKVFIVRNVVFARVNGKERQVHEGHRKILERMSLIQNRHPGVAFLYGRNNGPVYNRFIVLDVGDISPLRSVMPEGAAELSVLGQIVAKLADASCHLQKHGAAWAEGDTDAVYLDQNHEPKIGVVDDLGPMVSPGHDANWLEIVLAGILNISCAPVHSHEDQFARRDSKSSTWSSQLFGFLDTRYRTLCRKHVVLRADVIDLVPLSWESWTHLRRSSRDGGSTCPYWGCILLHLVTGNRKVEGSILHAAYRTRRSTKEDHLSVLCIESDADTVYYVETQFEIPPSATNDVRQSLGITVQDYGKDDGYVFFHLERFAGAGVTSMECTGWCKDSTPRPVW